MSDLIAGPATGGARGRGGDPRNGGAPPPVLMAALAAATLIGIVLFALLGRFGGGEDTPAASVRDADATPPAVTAQRERVTLTVTLLGSGDGVIQIQPGDIACIESCDHEFEVGKRVTVTADARSGSTFAGWDDACDGTRRCSIRMSAARALDATFDSKSDEPLDDEDLDGGTEELDPGAEDPAPPPAADCADGRDNDGDGLTDSAQDPDCTSGSAEAGSAASPGATPRPPAPPAAAANDCSDRKDNDGDGLTDTAQDPGCSGDRTETD